MPDTKLSGLSAVGTPAIDDLVYLVDVSDTTDDAAGSSRKMLLSQLLTLPSTEIAITGAGTATIGRMHLCTGTSADYTVTLPAVSGNAGKLIGFRMGNAAALTKLVTLDANASEKIDDSLTRVMWANEVAILYCDGTQWTKIAGKSIPMITAVGLFNAQAAIVTATTTKVLIDTVWVDTASQADISNHLINIRRAGTYSVTPQVRLFGIAAAVPRALAVAMLGTAYINANVRAAAEANLTSTAYAVLVTAAQFATFSAGDQITLWGFQDSGSNCTFYSGSSEGASFSNAFPMLTVEEKVSW